jgi:hypothetical protein
MLLVPLHFGNRPQPQKGPCGLTPLSGVAGSAGYLARSRASRLDSPCFFQLRFILAFVWFGGSAGPNI